MDLTPTGDFLSHVGEIMEDEVFRSFFDRYFNDWDDVAAAVMLMKAYKFLTKTRDASKADNVNALRRCMKDPEFRHSLANGMCEFMNKHASKIARALPNAND